MCESSPPRKHHCNRDDDSDAKLPADTDEAETHVVTVKTLTGNTIEVSMNEGKNTVRDLKAAIKKAEGTAIDLQDVVITKNAEVYDNSDRSSVPEGCIVHLMIKPKETQNYYPPVYNCQPYKVSILSDQTVEVRKPIGLCTLSRSQMRRQENNEIYPEEPIFSIPSSDVAAVFIGRDDRSTDRSREPTSTGQLNLDPAVGNYQSNSHNSTSLGNSILVQLKEDNRCVYIGSNIFSFVSLHRIVAFEFKTK